MVRRASAQKACPAHVLFRSNGRGDQGNPAVRPFHCALKRGRNLSGFLFPPVCPVKCVRHIGTDPRLIHQDVYKRQAFQGPAKLCSSPEGRKFLKEHGLEGQMAQAVHIAWATGGNLVPQDVRRQYYEKSRKLRAQQDTQ